MKNPAFILIFFFFFTTQPTRVDDVIESCLLKILKKYFNRKSALLVTDLTADQHQPFRSLLPDLKKEYQREIVRRIMKKRQVYITNKYLDLPAQMRGNMARGCIVFVHPQEIVSEMFDWEMEKMNGNPLWDSTKRNVVVVRARTSGNDSEALARKIIEKMWMRSKAVDNLVMVAEDDGTMQFYTWFPYRQPDCDRVKRVVWLDAFKRGRFQLKNELFPVKMAPDLQGCELRAATDTCIPYVFADDNDANKFVSGLEIAIVESLSKTLNFKLRTVRPEDMWTTSVNDSLMGAFKLLVEQNVDMAFSCLMLNQERYLLVLALPPYYEDSLVWFVPSPSFKTHVTDIFYTFPASFWLVMVSAMLSSSVLVGVMSYSEHAGTQGRVGAAVGNVVKLIGMSLYCPVGIRTKSPIFRAFIFVLVLYSMHITIAFQSSLFALYRHPQYNLFYSSLEEAVDAGLFVYLRSSSQALYNQSDHALWNEILQPGRFDYLTDFGEVFSQIAFDKTAIALFIKTTGIYMISVYFTDESGVPKVFWLSEKFSSYPVTIFLSPGNPLFPFFEKQIHRLMGSGLVRLWLERSVLVKNLELTNEGPAKNSLTMKHLGGAFLLLLLLLGTAMFTFLVEVLIFCVLRKGKERKKSKQRRLFLSVKEFEKGGVTVGGRQREGRLVHGGRRFSIRELGC